MDGIILIIDIPSLGLSFIIAEWEWYLMKHYGTECVVYNKIRLQIDPFGKHFIDGHPGYRFFLFFFFRKPRFLVSNKRNFSLHQFCKQKTRYVNT